MDSKSQTSEDANHSKSGRSVMWKIMQENLEDLKSYNLWRAVVAEFLGTTFLVLFGCGTFAFLGNAGYGNVQIALSFGLIVATMIWCFGHISGGHFNPAVSLGTCITRRVSIVRCFFFIVAQVIGAIAGAAILFGLLPVENRMVEGMGVAALNPKIDEAQGFGVEFIITFVYVFTVFASWDPKRRDLHGSSPLTAGLAVVVCHLFALPFTRAGMNSARCFGPAVVLDSWENHWVYWVGPLAGGLVAALLYDYIFAEDASVKRAKKCLLKHRRNRSANINTDEEKVIPEAIEIISVEQSVVPDEEKEAEKEKLADGENDVAAS